MFRHRKKRPTGRRARRTKGSACCTCRRSRRWASTSNGTCGRRLPACGRRPSGTGVAFRADGRRAVGRYAGVRTASAEPRAAGDPDHHAGIAVPDPHLASPRHAADGRDGDRRRDSLAGRHETRLAPVRVAGTAGGAAPRRRREPQAAAADRPVRHAAAAGRSGPAAGRRGGRRRSRPAAAAAAGPDHRSRPGQAAGFDGRGAGRGHGATWPSRSSSPARPPPVPRCRRSGPRSTRGWSN